MDADVFTGIIILRIDILCSLFKIDGHDKVPSNNVFADISAKLLIIDSEN